jgi:hypothetical protein
MKVMIEKYKGNLIGGNKNFSGISYQFKSRWSNVDNMNDFITQCVSVYERVIYEKCKDQGGMILYHSVSNRRNVPVAS